MKDFPPKNEFGGIDERLAQEMFENACGGVKRAERLCYLCNNSYPTGTLYDKTFKTGFYHSKIDNFISKAKREGYTEKQINMFLEL